MIAAYTALLYGREYLAYAIRSVIDYVDYYVVLYSPRGSHGHTTDLACPESRKELYAIASAAAGRKLIFVDGTWIGEGLQRDSVFEVVPDADVILVLDYDELWQPGLPELAIAAATKTSKVRNWLLPMRHYWRSFYRCVLHDPAYPVRIICPKIAGGTETLHTDGLAINHMGYAISPAMMNYKWQVHGHKAEQRRDVDWFHEVYLKNRQTDTHPCGSIYWNPEDVDPWQYMPAFMREHPWANCEVIE